MTVSPRFVSGNASSRGRDQGSISDRLARSADSWALSKRESRVAIVYSVAAGSHSTPASSTGQSQRLEQVSRQRSSSSPRATSKAAKNVHGLPGDDTSSGCETIPCTSLACRADHTEDHLPHGYIVFEAPTVGGAWRRGGEGRDVSTTRRQRLNSCIAQVVPPITSSDKIR